MKQFVGARGTKWIYDSSKTLGDPGGFGSVHPGHDENGTSVAVKFVPKVSARGDKLDTRLLRREAEIGKKIREADPRYLIRLLDVAETKSAHLLVMELGERALLVPAGGFGEQEVVSTMFDIASGLSELHQIAIIHRDLKPSNVLRHGGSWKLADFGIAHDSEIGTQDPTFKGWGSHPYMAPELWELRSASVKSDLYALGCLAHELVTGKRAFQGPGIDDYRRQHRSEAPPSIGGAQTTVLGSLISRLLRKDPGSRPQDARAVIEQLQRMVRPLDDQQKRLQLLAGEHERERSDDDTARATKLQHDRQAREALQQASADLIALLEEALVTLRGVLPEVELKDGVTGFGTTLGSEHATLGVQLWGHKPAMVAGDSMILAGAVLGFNRRSAKSFACLGNVVFEAVEGRYQWRLYRFKASAWSSTYRYGPRDGLHGLDERVFMDPKQRSCMMMPINHVWSLTKSLLTPASLVSLFEEAMALRPESTP